MKPNQIVDIAKTLHQARKSKTELSPFRESLPEFTVEDAYAVQWEGIHLREKLDHEKRIGMKMGLTSEAKRKQMNLDSPVYGVLTDAMQIHEGRAWDCTQGIHPKIEPEVAFRVSEKISSKISLFDARKLCTHICAAMEILDSRYRGFKYFSLPDVIADNSSSSHFVLGKEIPLDPEIDTRNLEMRFFSNQKLIETARSEAISGDPLQSLVELSILLEKTGAHLPAGSIVLTGAATTALPLAPGMEIRLDLQRCPSVSIST